MIISVNGISYVNLMTKNKMNNYIYPFWKKNIVPKIFSTCQKHQNNVSNEHTMANIADHNQSMKTNEMC